MNTYYDSQGFLIEEDGTHLRRTPQIEDYVNHLSSKAEDRSEAFKGALIALFNQHAESIINLDAIVKYQILGVIKAYIETRKEEASLTENDKEKLNRRKLERLSSFHVLVETQFAKSLKKHFKEGKINLTALNQDLDKLAKDFQKRVLDEFKKYPDEFPKVSQAKFKKNLNQTSIYPNGFLIQQGDKEIRCNSVTSHDPNSSLSAATPYRHGDKTWIRTPIIVPKSQNRVVEATQGIQACLDLMPQAQAQPLFYHLLTSYHQGLGRLLFDRSNQQSTRAIELMQIQDQWNREHEQKFYPIFLPVNGYGQVIRSRALDPNIPAMAWRNQLAFIQMLGSEEQKQAAYRAYEAYLTQQTSPVAALTRIVNELEISTLPEDAEPSLDLKLKNLLIYIIKNNLHETHMHELAKMIQAISLYLNANHAMVGCKSGNERTARILHRLDALIEDNLDIPKELTLEAILDFNQKLDKAVNDKHCAGFADFISLHDQHAVPKISPDKKFRINTNNAESAGITNLFTKSASGMQAHTNKLALSTLSYPSRTKIYGARLAVFASLGVIGLAVMTAFFPALLPFTLPLAAKIIVTTGLLGLAALGLKKYGRQAWQTASPSLKSTPINEIPPADLPAAHNEEELVDQLGPPRVDADNQSVRSEVSLASHPNSEQDSDSDQDSDDDRPGPSPGPGP